MRINKFREMQGLFMPRLRENLSPVQKVLYDSPITAEPEKMRLFMPSELSTAKGRLAACVSGVCEAESKLRTAEANDALFGLRAGLRTRTATNRFKIKNITGQAPNTRARDIQHQIDIRIHMDKLRYRYARKALLQLQGPGEWERELQELNDRDVRGLNERALTEHELYEQERFREKGLGLLEPGGIGAEGTVAVGEGHRQLSWVWMQVEGSENDATIHEGTFSYLCSGSWKLNECSDWLSSAEN